MYLQYGVLYLILTRPKFDCVSDSVQLGAGEESSGTPAFSVADPYTLLRIRIRLIILMRIRILIFI